MDFNNFTKEKGGLEGSPFGASLKLAWELLGVPSKVDHQGRQ
jgi:hypothetical protein